PDGQRLCYVTTRPNGHFNLYVRPIRDGRWAGEEIALTRDHRYPRDRLYFGPWDMHIEPAWTRDGKEIVFVSNRDVPLGSGDLWRMPVPSASDLPTGGSDLMSKAERILREQTLYRTRPDVSIDGKRIVYSSTAGAADQYAHLYVLPIGGGAPYKLTFGSHDDFHPRWSPDGEWITYISNEGGLPQLCLLETYGGERRRVGITSRHWKRPMGRVHARVVNGGSGAQTAARIYAPAVDGKFYPPPDAYARIAGTRMTYRSGEHIFHTEGEFTIEAPVGKLSLEAVKGFEYWPAKQDVEVRADKVTDVTLTLKPLVTMRDKGW